jgi:dTDP-glucose pyrophosphorylase
VDSRKKAKMKRKIIGILPMAGKGSRLQPIAFSKELYPVSFKSKHFAISEFNIRAMMKANVQEIKLVVHPTKLDIAKYYAESKYPTSIYFYSSKSLPESCLFPLNAMHDDDLCLFGLPDTLFSPADGFKKIRNELENGYDLVLGTFKVEDASKYDSVGFDPDTGKVKGIIVKKSPPLSEWIWGIWGANVRTLKLLKKEINQQRVGRSEKLLGVGFNSLVTNPNVKAKALCLGNHFFDIGTMDAVVKIQRVINNFEF